jgi:hypothetical protein
MGHGAGFHPQGRAVTEVFKVVGALGMERRWTRELETLVEPSGIGATDTAAAAQRSLVRATTAVSSQGVASGPHPGMS